MDRVLAIIVFLSGVGLIVIGAGVGLGGFRTLGLQIDPDFISITNENTFRVQDNHTRYLGGFFFMGGVVCAVGAFHINQFRPALMAVFAMIAGGAIFRFSDSSANLLSSDLFPSLMLEVVFAPLIALWLWRANRES